MFTQNQLDSFFDLAVTTAGQSTSEDAGDHPKVGAVLVDASGDVIETAYRGEAAPGAHAEFSILSKTKERRLDLRHATLFVTLEPCTTRGPGKTPCAERIATAGIKVVYVGMSDPNRAIQGEGVRVLRQHGIQVEHFPHRHVLQLEEMNRQFIAQQLRERLPYEHFFVARQTSELMADYLRRTGIAVDALPDEWDANLSDIERCVDGLRGEMTPSQVIDLIKLARMDAFERKYSDQTYAEDARNLSEDWQQTTRRLLTAHSTTTWMDKHILIVGIGNGLEAVGLFDRCPHLTGVDLSQRALTQAETRLPMANLIVCDAENLLPIATASQDVYLSFRTFQSSYFHLSSAIREAHRILRPGGLLLLSIANGYRGPNGSLLPGLLIPRSNLTDVHRPWDVCDKIRRRVHKLAFESFGMDTAKTEIFLYARRGR